MAVDDRARRAIDVTSRVIAAAGGGYLLTTVASIAIAAVLPVGRADAVMTAMLLTFAIYVAAIVWAFAARSAIRAWLGLGIPIALSAALVSAFSGSVA